ncbi:hypothetical protein GCM10010411_80630 [Actinomadura fulvescens]|uniref:Uncharacterized protein n=1 Tax=Actinomadura fulvescens TaxID=46160 RepID=A0ABN3QMU5_9ACTN
MQPVGAANACGTAASDAPTMAVPAAIAVSEALSFITTPGVGTSCPPTWALHRLGVLSQADSAAFRKVNADDCLPWTFRR